MLEMLKRVQTKALHHCDVCYNWYFGLIFSTYLNAAISYKMTCQLQNVAHNDKIFTQAK